MPIWLRKFTFNKLRDHYDKVKKQQEPIISEKKQALGPNIQPSFITKGSKK